MGSHRGILLLTLGVMLLTSVGCVQRRLTLRSFPEGAMAYVDDQDFGQSPVSTSFTHFGVRSIRLEKDGFESVKLNQISLKKVGATKFEILDTSTDKKFNSLNNLKEFLIETENIINATC